jgi:hypothetical protein
MNATHTKSGITAERIAKKFQGLAQANGWGDNADVQAFGALLETFSEAVDGELDALKIQLTDVAAQVRALTQPPSP